MKTNIVSNLTRNNWIVAASLGVFFLLASLSGAYFLYMPTNGFQGGRNTLHNATILFNRSGWDVIHTWTGTIMTAIVLIHLILHWNWVLSMAKRAVLEVTGKCGCLNLRGRLNLYLNIVVAVSFFLTALSGVYFLAFPNHRDIQLPLTIFNRTGWDNLHTWSSVVFIAAVLVHVAIHWKWVTKVASRLIPAPVNHLRLTIAGQCEK